MGFWAFLLGFFLFLLLLGGGTGLLLVLGVDSWTRQAPDWSRRWASD